MGRSSSRTGAELPGAVFEVAVRDGFAYFQRAFIADRQKKAPDAIRVFPGVYISAPEMCTLASNEESFWILFQPLRYLRKRAITFVGNLESVGPYSSFPPFVMSEADSPGRYWCGTATGLSPVTIADDELPRLPRYAVADLLALQSFIELLDAVAYLKDSNRGFIINEAYLAYSSTYDAAREHRTADRTYE